MTATTPPLVAVQDLVKHFRLPGGGRSGGARYVHAVDGVSLEIERGEFVSAANDEAWQILGSKGSLRMHMREPKNKKILLDTSDAKEGVSTQTIWEGDDVGSSNLALLEDFARAIRRRSWPIAVDILRPIAYGAPATQPAGPPRGLRPAALNRYLKPRAA